MDKKSRDRGRELLAGRTPGKLKVVKQKDAFEIVSDAFPAGSYLGMVAEVVYREEDAELFCEAPELLEEALDYIDKLEDAFKGCKSVENLCKAIDVSGAKISFDPKDCCHPNAERIKYKWFCPDCDTTYDD